VRNTRKLMIALAAAGLVGAAAGWLLTEPHPAFASKDLAEQGDPERGRVIFAAGDCASCHASPGQNDSLKLGGGLALASPYGTFRVPNISMDVKDGIGSWRTSDLGNALRSGVSPAGKHYYPVFPYSSYTHMETGDIQDLMAYLRTLPAVSGRAPPHEIALPFRIRRGLGFWKLLFFEQGPLPDDPGRDATWRRGRYLVEAVAHCAECHSARNILGAIKPKTRYAGAVDPEGTGFVPNITPSRIGNWSERDLIEMLKTGITPNHGRVGSSMTAVVTNTASLEESDRSAIAAYVRTFKAIPTPRP
jgi:mono/diheme cytochrome c family protein